MSKHHHSSTMFEINRLVGEVIEMDPEEVLRMHGITQIEDGSVYDTISGVYYDTLIVWARSVVSEEAEAIFQQMPHKHRFDDEWA